MENDIKYIQNYIWEMYKDFNKELNVTNYENRAEALCEKYKDNQLLLSFCQNMFVSWTPVINQIKYVKGDIQNG